MLLVNDLLEALLRQRRRLLARVAHVEGDLHWLDVHVAPEREEEGQEASLARVLARLDERDRAELESINAALVRIANGDYGRCVTCGGTIPADRLHVLPATTRCLGCARDAESTGLS